MPLSTGLLPRELPIIGTYVHPEIIIGAKYKVRSLRTNKHLFGGAALTLLSIGRGYGKRITFESESLLYSDNYFYSDSCQDGYGFTIEALSVGDYFRWVLDVITRKLILFHGNTFLSSLKRTII